VQARRQLGNSGRYQWLRYDCHLQAEAGLLFPVLRDSHFRIFQRFPPRMFWSRAVDITHVLTIKAILLGMLKLMEIHITLSQSLSSVCSLISMRNGIAIRALVVISF
jgi:hypothetical protein